MEELPLESAGGESGKSEQSCRARAEMKRSWFSVLFRYLSVSVRLTTAQGVLETLRGS